MCLILFAYDAHPEYRLIVAANRDEFYERPTAQAAFWEDDSGVLAGRDLRNGGTWLGLSRSGRFAAVTNYRGPDGERPDAPSRGALVASFLRGTESAEAYLLRLAAGSERYNGFNLLVDDGEHLCYYSNREDRVRRVEPGVHGLSNHLLDTPWPKVESGKAAFGQVVRRPFEDAELLAVLADATPAADADLPDTGVGDEWERVLSPRFIATPVYGTRTSTVVRIGRRGEASFVERTVETPTQTTDTRSFRFSISVADPSATSASSDLSESDPHRS